MADRRITKLNTMDPARGAVKEEIVVQRGSDRVFGQALWKCSRCEARGGLHLPIDSGPTEVKTAVSAAHVKASPDCDTSERGVLSITSDLPKCQPPRSRFATGGRITR